jgi:hypothetical protein
VETGHYRPILECAGVEHLPSGPTPARAVFFLSFTYGAAERQSDLFAGQQLNVLRVQELRQFLLSLLSGFSWDSLLVEEGFPGQTGLALNTY